MSKLDAIPPIADADHATNFCLSVAIFEVLAAGEKPSKDLIIVRALQLLNFFVDDSVALETSQRLNALEDLFDGQTLYRPNKKLPPFKAIRNK